MLPHLTVHDSSVSNREVQIDQSHLHERSFFVSKFEDAEEDTSTHERWVEGILAKEVRRISGKFGEQ